MTVTIENLAGGAKKVIQPWLPPVDTQVKAWADTFARSLDDNPTLNPYGALWMSVNSSNQGLTPRLYQENVAVPRYSGLKLFPTGNDPAAEAWVILFPWNMAWMTQFRCHQISAMGIVDFQGVSGEFDLSEASGIKFLLTCFSGWMTGDNATKSMAYALVMEPLNTTQYACTIEKFHFGSVPNMASSIGPEREVLLNCGPVSTGDRVMLQNIDFTSYWSLAAFATQYFPAPQPTNWRLLGKTTDGEIQRGMGAFGGSNGGIEQDIYFIDFATAYPAFFLTSAFEPGWPDFTGPNPAAPWEPPPLLTGCIQQ